MEGFEEIATKILKDINGLEYDTDEKQMTKCIIEWFIYKCLKDEETFVNVMQTLDREQLERKR